MQQSSLGTSEQHVWSQHVNPWVKANWDLVVEKEHTRIHRYWGCDKKFMGGVLETMRAPIDFCADSTSTEARTALTICLFCRDLGLTNVILEGDAKLIVNAGNKSQEKFTAMFG